MPCCTCFRQGYQPAASRRHIPCTTTIRRADGNEYRRKLDCVRVIEPRDVAIWPGLLHAGNDRPQRARRAAIAKRLPREAVVDELRVERDGTAAGEDSAAVRRTVRRWAQADVAVGRQKRARPRARNVGARRRDEKMRDTRDARDHSSVGERAAQIDNHRPLRIVDGDDGAGLRRERRRRIRAARQLQRPLLGDRDGSIVAGPDRDRLRRRNRDGRAVAARHHRAPAQHGRRREWGGRVETAERPAWLLCERRRRVDESADAGVGVQRNRPERPQIALNDRVRPQRRRARAEADCRAAECSGARFQNQRASREHRRIFRQEPGWRPNGEDRGTGQRLRRPIVDDSDDDIVRPPRSLRIERIQRQPMRARKQRDRLAAVADGIAIGGVIRIRQIAVRVRGLRFIERRQRVAIRGELLIGPSLRRRRKVRERRVGGRQNRQRERKPRLAALQVAVQGDLLELRIDHHRQDIGSRGGSRQTQ